ncbi:MAG TPA: hypothetical protein VD794_00600 [Flavisolibacter sp.]|nr:hypothetical protein [Flavisolibacter sp.]
MATEHEIRKAINYLYESEGTPVDSETVEFMLFSSLEALKEGKEYKPINRRTGRPKNALERETEAFYCSSEDIGRNKCLIQCEMCQLKQSNQA